MSNTENEALLPPSVLRNIGDKMYEKRKVAALEVEQIMKKLGASGARDKVKFLLGKLVNDYALSGQANRRKGGLLCLAAATVALKRYYDRLKFNYLGQIIEPVSLSLNDQDARVRYYACEALYNIAKAMQEEFISNQELFLNVFNALFNLYGDTDSNVQNAAQHLDEVLKGIVTSSPTFDISNLMQCLKDNLFATNVHKRQFLIGWVVALFSVPSIDMLPYLPSILPGLMNMLDDNIREIRQLTMNALEDFLDELKGSAGESSVDYTAVMEVLLDKCYSVDTATCLMALKWMGSVVEIAPDEVMRDYGPMVGAVLSCISHTNLDVQRAAQSVNSTLLQTETRGAWKSLDMRDLVQKINKELSSNQEPTRLEALRWLEFLLMQCPDAVLDECESVVNAVLDALTMHWDRVVKSGIHLLALLARQKQQFRFVMEALLRRFQGKEGLKLLHSSGAFIIQRLALQLGSKAVLGELAVALQAASFESDFCSTIVQALNVLLVTSPELSDLPQLLRRGLQDEEAKLFFLVLFPAWSRSVCAVLTICFLVQAYEFAWKLIRDFGNSLYGTSADAMVQIVRLVKLIEAPAFGFLRLELIQHEQYKSSLVGCSLLQCPVFRNPYLLKCLHGLLMLLPQTDAFHTLVDRLKSLPNCSCTSLYESHAPKNAAGLQEEALLKVFAENRARHTITRIKSEAETTYVPLKSTPSFSFPTTFSITGTNPPADAASSS